MSFELWIAGRCEERPPSLFVARTLRALGALRDFWSRSGLVLPPAGRAGRAGGHACLSRTLCDALPFHTFAASARGIDAPSA